MDTAGSTRYTFGSATATQAYAISIAKALSIAEQIESGQASTRVHIGSTPFLGIEVATNIAAGGFSSAGAVLADVLFGGPAASAGLSAGDVITAISGRAISSSSMITSILLTKKARRQGHDQLHGSVRR